MLSTELLELKQRRFPPTADRRMPRVCYLADRPAFLQVKSALYAVHDIGGGGLRLSQYASPAVPSPEVNAALPTALGKALGGVFRLRSGGSVRLEAVVARVDPGGVLLVPVPARPGAWISDDQLTREATWVRREEEERRQSPRVAYAPVPRFPGAEGGTIQDLSPLGFRVTLPSGLPIPRPGETLSGELHVGLHGNYSVRGEVLRVIGREVAVRVEPPGVPAAVVLEEARRHPKPVPAATAFPHSGAPLP
jgi:hypothetical protein